MGTNIYDELVLLIQQMIDDKVQLIHSGQVINWEDTKIPDILNRINKKSNSSNENATLDFSKN